MAELVDPETIEAKVGAKRYPTMHIARAVSAEETVYVLHSSECIDDIASRTSDLSQCPFARALDAGIDEAVWADFQDVPVHVVISPEWGDLEPMEVIS
jgi:hypothetical protein